MNIVMVHERATFLYFGLCIIHGYLTLLLLVQNVELMYISDSSQHDNSIPPPSDIPTMITCCLLSICGSLLVA